MTESTKFVRKPFIVEGVLVTTDNISELAEEIGELQHKEDGTPFIVVDRKKIPGVWNVYPGFVVTRNEGKIRCFSRKSFMEQFVNHTPAIEEWVNFIEGEKTTMPSVARTPPVLGDFGTTVELPEAEEVNAHAENSG